MSVTLQSFSSSLNNSIYSPYESQLPWYVSGTPTSTKVDFSASLPDELVSFSIYGNFDTTKFNTNIKSSADFFINQSASTRTTVSSFKATVAATKEPINSKVFQLATFSPPVNAGLLSLANDKTDLTALNQVYAGDDSFITGLEGGTPDRVYGYSGNDNYYEQHALRMSTTSSYDSFVGGPGLDSAVLPGKRANYVLTASNSIYDSNSLKSNLPGFIITDSTKKINTLQVNTVERIQFADTTLAFDFDGNAGLSAKLIGTIFGPSFVSNATYEGIGIGLLDAGSKFEDVAGLAVTAAGLATPAQVVSTIWKNLFGVSPSNNDLNTYVNLLNSGTSYGSLASMAANSVFASQAINLSTYATTGLGFIPSPQQKLSSSTTPPTNTNTGGSSSGSSNTLVLSSTTPTNNTQNLPSSTKITFTFPEKISATAGSISLIEPTGKENMLNILQNPLISISNNTLSIASSNFYQSTGIYSVSIPANLIHGASGTHYAGLNNYSIGIIGLIQESFANSDTGGGGGGGGGGGD